MRIVIYFLILGMFGLTMAYYQIAIAANIILGVVIIALSLICFALTAVVNIIRRRVCC